MQNLLFKITQIRLQVMDASGTISQSKDYNFTGAKSTAIGKLSKATSVPSEVLYRLRKSDEAEHTYFDGTKLKIQIIKGETKDAKNPTT